jgi:hypothetical protein
MRCKGPLEMYSPQGSAEKRGGDVMQCHVTRWNAPSLARLKLRDGSDVMANIKAPCPSRWSHVAMTIPNTS